MSSPQPPLTTINDSGESAPAYSHIASNHSDADGNGSYESDSTQILAESEETPRDPTSRSHTQGSQTQVTNPSSTGQPIVLEAQPGARGLSLIQVAISSASSLEEQLRQLDAATQDASLSTTDRRLIASFTIAICHMQLSEQETHLARIRFGIAHSTAQRNALQETRLNDPQPTVNTMSTVDTTPIVNNTPIEDTTPPAPLQTHTTVVQPPQERMTLHEYARRVHAINAYHMRALTATPPTLYTDPFDKFVGQPTRLATGPHEQPSTQPLHIQEDARMHLGNRSLVQMRHARALAGLDVSELDGEIAWRVVWRPERWGRVGEFMRETVMVPGVEGRMETWISAQGWRRVAEDEGGGRRTLWPDVPAELRPVLRHVEGERWWRESM